MEILSSQPYTMYFWYQIYATDLFSIIALFNSGNTCLLQKGFFTVYFGGKEKNVVTLPHIAQRKHVFLGEIKGMSKTKKLPARKESSLELLHQRLGHRST